MSLEGHPIFQRFHEFTPLKLCYSKSRWIVLYLHAYARVICGAMTPLLAIKGRESSPNLTKEAILPETKFHSFLRWRVPLKVSRHFFSPVEEPGRVTYTGLHVQKHKAYTNLGTSCHNVYTKFFCWLLMHIIMHFGRLREHSSFMWQRGGGGVGEIN